MISSLLRRLRRDLLQPFSGSGHPFWRGAVLGALLFVLLLWGITGYHFRTGWSPLLTMSAGLLAGAIAFVLFGVAGWLLLHGVRSLPNFALAALAGAIGVLIAARAGGFGWPEEFYFPVTVALMAVNALGAGSLWYGRRYPRPHWMTAAMLLALLIDIAAVWWLVQDGRNPFPVMERGAEPVRSLAEKGVASPAAAGSYAVDYFTYGSGNDRCRPEYGDEVRFTTTTVDARRLLPEWKGRKKKWRERYWGFGVASFPLNGRVWRPRGEGPFPLILIVHGNHGMEDYSDGGYAYLGELLASRGFLTVSVDENFLNGTWSGDFRGREMPARAWLLLRHLQQWRTWSETPGHELSGLADLQRVLLVGHSRGGEAVAIAAAFNRLPRFPDDANVVFDFGFGIRGLLAIAPTDKRYHRRLELENIDYLALQGSYDSDEASHFGWRQAQRIAFTDSSYHFKAGLYIHRANHGQFNSSWGRKDAGAPYSWLLNLQPLLLGEQQRQIARVYISAFAEAVLHDDRAYLPLFRRAGAAGDWLPKTQFINNFRSSRDRLLLDFEEDIDPTKGKNGITLRAENFRIWREEPLRFRDKDTQGNNALVLGWQYEAGAPPDSIPVYEIELPDAARPDAGAQLLISLAAGDPGDLPDKKEKKNQKKTPAPPPHFTIELEDTLGRRRALPVQEYRPLTPRLRVRYLKTRSLSRRLGAPWEATLESYAIPWQSFQRDTAAFDVQALRYLRLRFDQVEQGVVIVDEIGWGN